jgi:hypothetical protein
MTREYSSPWPSYLLAYTITLTGEVNLLNGTKAVSLHKWQCVVLQRSLVCFGTQHLSSDPFYSGPMLCQHLAPAIGPFCCQQEDHNGSFHSLIVYPNSFNECMNVQRVQRKSRAITTPSGSPSSGSDLFYMQQALQSAVFKESRGQKKKSQFYWKFKSLHKTINMPMPLMDI